MKKLEKIVIIDDDPICSWLNRAFLEDLEIAHTIDCYSDGNSALEYFRQNCTNADEAFPDLIFLDINMPGIDGFQFLEKLRSMEGCELLPSDRIIFLSTSMHKRDIERAQRFNVRDYLVKPLSEAKITEVLRILEQERSQPHSTTPTQGSLPMQEDRLPAEKPASTNAENSKTQIDL